KDSLCFPDPPDECTRSCRDFDEDGRLPCDADDDGIVDDCNDHDGSVHQGADADCDPSSVDEPLVGDPTAACADAAACAQLCCLTPGLLEGQLGCGEDGPM